MFRAAGARGAAAAGRALTRRGVQARGMAKDVRFSNEGRAEMLAGVERLADAVRATSGGRRWRVRWGGEAGR